MASRLKPGGKEYPAVRRTKETDFARSGTPNVDIWLWIGNLPEEGPPAKPADYPFEEP
jgi:hypothetical protein